MELPTAEPPKGPEEVVQAIEEALQDEGLVLTRETDLEAIGQFIATAQQGMLHVVIEGDPDQEADIECLFGRTPLGEYIIQWHSDSIEDVMTNGRTYLSNYGHKADNFNPVVYFKRARELFYGTTKAFVVCEAV